MKLRSPNVLSMALAALTLSAGGCGLSEYERRVDAQRARIEKFDGLNRSLDDPIDTPYLQVVKQVEQPKDGAKDVPKETPKEEIKAWPDEVFLRLPKGASSFQRERKLPLEGFPLFRYSSRDPNFNIFVAAASIQEPRKANEFGKYVPASFRGFVRDALFRFMAPAKTEPPFPDKVKYLSRAFAAFSAYPDEEATVKYEYIQYADKARLNVFDAYFHEQHGRQMCIVFHRVGPLADRLAAEKEVAVCLGALDISNDAPRKRALFKKTKNP